MGIAALNPSYKSSLRHTLAKCNAVYRNIAGPILRINATLDHAMKGRMRPVAHPRHETMLDRVDMDVVDMPREIGLVTGGALPIAPLPDATFAFGGTAVGNHSR